MISVVVQEDNISVRKYVCRRRPFELALVIRSRRMRTPGENSLSNRYGSTAVDGISKRVDLYFCTSDFFNTLVPHPLVYIHAVYVSSPFFKLTHQKSYNVINRRDRLTPEITAMHRNYASTPWGRWSKENIKTRLLYTSTIFFSGPR